MSTPTTLPPISEIDSLDGYLIPYGRILGLKANKLFSPLHTPGVTELDDMSEFKRAPFEPQAHVITAISRMFDSVGSGFLCGTMGTGKTLLGMCAIHKHANGQPYRAIVLCPDHLIAKWQREIEGTIQGAVVRTFDNWKGIVDLIEAQAPIVRKTTAGHTRDHKRWPKPLGPEWVILGRNQAKRLPKWLSIAEPYRGEKSTHHDRPLSAHKVSFGKEPQVDDMGQPVCNPETGVQLQANKIGTIHRCPRCGNVVRNKKGEPASGVDIAKSQATCKTLILRAVHDSDGKMVWRGPDVMTKLSSEIRGDANNRAGKRIKYKGGMWEFEECGEPLWCFTRQPNWWAPAKIIQKKLRRFFRYLVVDEAHEHKSDETAQSMACGKLMAASRHTLAMTGTLIGGYANHLFPLMLRITPETLKHEGFEWGKDMDFSQTYGKVDRIVTTTEQSEVSVGRNVGSMRRSRASGVTRSERKAVRPGIMPSLFGRHLLGSSVFITLEEMSEELPDLFEYVGGPVAPLVDNPKWSDDERWIENDRHRRAADSWQDVVCTMPPEMDSEYKLIESILVEANKELLKKGSMKLLGSTLATLMAYPDMPFAEEWPGRYEGEMAVGYHVKPKIYTKENWVSVVQPAGLDRSITYPKEQALIDICVREKGFGNQCWVYTEMTGKRNIQPRLKRLLEGAGLKVGVLRSGTVNLKEREEWITKNGGDYDVVISHPELVKTGLDLFATDGEGTHNFNTIIFYQTGYKLFTLRQASRRSWRIGQPKDCKLYYLYYKETMQHRAMALMSKKMEAAVNLEGEFSAEGLALLAGEGSEQMALAKALSERLDDADMQRSWGKVASGSTKKPKVQARVREIDVAARTQLALVGAAKPRVNLSQAKAIQRQLVEEQAAEFAAAIAASAKEETAPETVEEAMEGLDFAALAEMFRRLTA